MDKETMQHGDWPVGAPEEGANKAWADFTRRPIWISRYATALEDRRLDSNNLAKDDNVPPPPGFEYAEHRFLGNQLTLKYMNPKSPTDRRPDGKEVLISAFKLPLLTLGEGLDNLNLTYGEISALAGDFYGTSRPISDARGIEDAKDRFLDAYNTLANNPAAQPKDARVLITHLRQEVNAVQKLYEEKKDPSEYYKDGTGKAGMDKIDKLIAGRNFPLYSDLLKINWDHFGDDARKAYTAGHLAAISWVASGEQTVDRLVQGYAMNAFADHYLQDLFSAGHLRTPRRLLHGGACNIIDECLRKCNKMHDEDCALGLSVANKRGSTWQAFGDKRLLDKVNEENLLKCQSAMVESASEVYEAWLTRREAPEPSDFTVWNIVPTKESALDSHQVLAPLFKLGPMGTYKDLERRLKLADRRVWKFKTDWWPVTTVAETYTSGLWKYPMTM